MADLNELQLTGRLTKDPDLRSTPEGRSVCNFRIACNGYREDQTIYLDVDVWGAQGEACAQYLSKGSRVAVAGRLGIRDWVSQQGEARRSVECNSARAYFLETKAESEAHREEAAVSASEPSQTPAPAGSTATAPPPPADDDDIPF